MKLLTLQQQILAMAPLDSHGIAILAGYASYKQLNDYRAKNRRIPDARLERLAVRLEELATQARSIKENPT